jgi:hypothetical protein
MNRALSRHGRSAEQKADGEAQPALRRSARILERKIRAQEPDHAGRLPDGKEDRNQLKPHQHGMLLDYSVTQRASVSGPLDHRSGTQPIPPTRMDSLCTPNLTSHSTPRHLSVPAVGSQGRVQIQQLGWSRDEWDIAALSRYNRARISSRIYDYPYLHEFAATERY